MKYSKVAVSTDDRIMSMWDQTMNEMSGLDPDVLTTGSSKEAFLICGTCGHDWTSEIRRLSAGNGCPACAGYIATSKRNLLVLHPEVAAQLVDDIDPTTLTPKAMKKLRWTCENGHVWRATVANRTTIRANGHATGCPFCCTNSARYKLLKDTRPDLYDELMVKDERLHERSAAAVEWKCSNHSHPHPHFTALPIDRISDDEPGCPLCARDAFRANTSLYAKNPSLAGRLAPTETKAPADIDPESGDTCIWECDAGHHFHAAVAAVAAVFECPHCRSCSQGEDLVSRILASLGVVYHREWTFGDLKSRRGTYRYDFAVMMPGEEAPRLIEYHGIQHGTVGQAGSRFDYKAVKKIQAADALKEKYASDNGIRMLVIWESDRERAVEVITDFLSGK
jgi:hypothetical protein